MNTNQLFEKLWQDYGKINPAAHRVHALISAQGETVLNDHVAFRTYNHPKIGLKKMSQVFERLGYVAKGEYKFEEKKLFAKHFEHPDMSQPKVFISELETEKFSPLLQKTVENLIEQVPSHLPNQEDFVVCGRPWNVSYSTYQQLLKESEYAAWMAAFGFRVNHFTINVNALKKLSTLPTLNAFIKSNGYKLNSSGGEIKGSPSVFLEQSSTLAEKVSVAFTDGEFEIPSVYYEFALRYKMPNGQLYQGFVEKSADKIFESTDTKLQRA